MIQEYQKILSQRDFSLPKLLQNYFKSPTLHLELGLKTEGLISLEQKEKIPIENTMSENSLNLITNNQLQQKPEEKLSMQESQQKNNQKISNDKLICSEKNSLLMNLYKILEAELTSKEKALEKYWTLQSKEISKKLWLPTKTDCVELDSNFLNNSLPNFPMQKSWFSTKVTVPLTKNWQKISLQSSLFSQPLSTDVKDTNQEKKEKLTTMKLRIFFPKEENKQLLNTWFGMSRYTYNNTLISLKVLTDSNPLNSLYNDEDKKDTNKCEYILKSGKRKGMKCRKDCVGNLCYVHLNIDTKKENACEYIPKTGKKKYQKCNRKCNGKYCVSHLKVVEKIANKGKGKMSKITNISIRKFVEKIKINDSVDFNVNTSTEERKDILEKFVKTIDTPDGSKYVFDENKEEKIWRPEWCKKFPSRMFRGTIQTLTQDINSCLSNGNLKLNMRLKTKKDKTFMLNSDQWNGKNSPLPSELGDISGFYSIGRKRIYLNDFFKNIVSNEKRNYQLLRDEFNRYWLCLPVSSDFFSKLKDDYKGIIRSENKATKFPVCSLDPGVRTFQTVYGLNHIVEIGKGDCYKIFELLKLQDLYISRIDTFGKKRKLKKRLQNIRRRVSGLINDLHRKTVSFLTSNYEVILLPVFETSGMVRSKKLCRMTKRQLLAFGFYKFKQRMIDKCWKKGIPLRIVSEAFTTKCCSECGTLVDIGGSEIFKCPSRECSMFDVEIGRDFNAPRNTLIRNM